MGTTRNETQRSRTKRYEPNETERKNRRGWDGTGKKQNSNKSSSALFLSLVDTKKRTAIRKPFPAPATPQNMNQPRAFSNFPHPFVLRYSPNTHHLASLSRHPPPSLYNRTRLKPNLNLRLQVLQLFRTKTELRAAILCLRGCLISSSPPESFLTNKNNMLRIITKTVTFSRIMIFIRHEP